MNELPNRAPSSHATLLTARDAARLLCVSERTLWKLAQPRGPIPVVRIGRAVRYSVADLAAFIDRQKSTVTD